MPICTPACQKTFVISNQQLGLKITAKMLQVKVNYIMPEQFFLSHDGMNANSLHITYSL